MVIALAALLWLVYLMPTWFRRREYLATERNAVRLQQTLRILAQTAEVPETVRVESTARDVAEQRRLLRIEHEKAQAEALAKEQAMAAAAAHTRSLLVPGTMATAARTQTARRLRISRLATTSVLALSLVAIVIGAVPAVASAGIVITGAIVAALAVAMLTRMATVSRRRPAAVQAPTQVAAAPRRTASSFEALIEEPVAEEAVASSWMPVPLPKPLYLSTPTPQARVSQAALALAREQLTAEAEAAELAQREAEVLFGVPSIARRAEPAARTVATAAPASNGGPQSRFASMGIIDDAPAETPDLDAVLRIRRAG